jgi:hypothetical protein
MKANKYKYEPYNGPAGPSKEQKENNTLCLAELLKQKNIPFETDREWAKIMWGGDELGIVIKKGNVSIVAGYDRWGFVVESNNFVDIDVDQCPLDETVDAIVKWYNS